MVEMLLQISDQIGYDCFSGRTRDRVNLFSCDVLGMLERIFHLP